MGDVLKTFLDLRHDGIQEWLHVAPYSRSSVTNSNERYLGCIHIGGCNTNYQKETYQTTVHLASQVVSEDEP